MAEVDVVCGTRGVKKRGASSNYILRELTSVVQLRLFKGMHVTKEELDIFRRLTI